MKLNPVLLTDCYKLDHRNQYPVGTNKVYSNFTPRSAKLSKNNVLWDFDNRIVFFGLQGWIKWFLQDLWQREFFDRPKEDVLVAYKRRVEGILGPEPFSLDHIVALHDLGYLPIKIMALKEGTRVPIGVPVLTIENTLPEFFWLTNYLETAMSADLWKGCTTATTAYEYRRLFENYARATGSPLDFVDIQGHDFSMRGLSGTYDASMSSAGHLLSFIGTDTIPAIDYLESYYNADVTKELVGVSVPATEHSVISMGTKEGEIDTFRRLITQIYPTGIVSIVSDTWDFWKVITEYATILKQDILDRQPNAFGLAKVVFRPDTGDPVKIICGDKDAEPGTPEHKGAVQCLWEIFGGQENEFGYKTLNERVGLIYGDSITLSRAHEILWNLHKNGFASNNIVFGIGSYTYNYCTRDTFGWAVKATYGEVNGEPREIYKDPATDKQKLKKSARGLLSVRYCNDNGLKLVDRVDPNSHDPGLLRTVFENGKLLTDDSLAEIRKRLRDV